MAKLEPEARAELTRWLEQQRKVIKKQRRTRVDPGLIKRMEEKYRWLEDRYYHEEALEVVQVAFEGLKYVKQPAARQSLSYGVWRSKAVTSSWLGRYGDSIQAYEKAADSAAEAAHIHENQGKIDPKRNLQAAIDYTTLGNARREAALEREAIPADAYEAFENALRVLKKVSFSDQELIDRESDVYLGRGRTLFSQGRYDEALQDLQRSVSLASDMNLAQHAATHRLFIGEVQVRLDDPEAEASLEEAAHYAEQYGTPETRWRALYELALLRQLQGRSGEAVEGLRECIATIEGLRSQYLPEPLKISMLAAKEDVYSAIVQILCSSKGSENEVATRAMEAFDYAERAKSRVFAEQLAATDLDSIGIAGIPPKLLNQERELARELRLLRAEHLENLTKGTYDWGEEALKLESRLTKVRDRMRRTPEGDEYVALREAAALDYSGARTFLHANDRIGKPSETGSEYGANVGGVVLAAYFVLDEEVIIFIGHPNLEVPELYRVALSRERLKDWAFTIENTDADDLGMWDLDEWQCELGPLVEPLEKWITEGDLVWFVPHAELHLLPLHALKVGGRYLVERNPVAYTPSASIMSYCRVKGTGDGTQALVFGDSLQPPHNLVHAREEAKAVAEMFCTEPLIGNAATKGELKDKLRMLGDDLRLLHVACHGDFDHVNPLRSRIKLAPPMNGESNDEDPDLSAAEVLGIEVKADLATLSACASGVSGRQGGDELIGLTRSFLYAGTPSVVVGLWYVADRSTRLLMGRFYDTLLGAENIAGQANTGKILTKAEALRQAQQYVLRTKQYEHPYFWAPFILVGDWH